MIYVGKEIPKLLLQDWREVSAMHIGHGVWIFRLEVHEKTLTSSNKQSQHNL